jgi:hypothetical protein
VAHPKTGLDNFLDFGEFCRAMATKKTKSKKKVPAARKPAKKKPAALTRDDKNVLLRARDGAIDLAFDIATTWENEKGLRFDTFSPAKLRARALKSRKLGQKRTQLEEKQARQLQPIADAHLIADDSLWRGLLDVRAAIALKARVDPTIEKRFAPLLDALKNRKPPAKDPTQK